MASCSKVSEGLRRGGEATQEDGGKGQKCFVADSKNIWRLKTKKPRQLFLARAGKKNWDQS